MKKSYSYPCENCIYCPYFIDGAEIMSFKKFCKKYCARCPECIKTDIPKEEIKKRRKQYDNT